MKTLAHPHARRVESPSERERSWAIPPKSEMPKQYRADWTVEHPASGEPIDLSIGWFRHPGAVVSTDIKPTDEGVWLTLRASRDGQALASSARLVPWPK